MLKQHKALYFIVAIIAAVAVGALVLVNIYNFKTEEEISVSSSELSKGEVGKDLSRNETENWQVYRNEEHRFEFKYPLAFDKFIEDTSDTDSVIDFIGVAEGKNGYLGVWAVDKKLDPNRIEDAFGNVAEVQKIKIGDQEGFIYYDQDEGCGGHTVKIGRGDITIQMNLVSCETDEKPFLAENATELTGLEAQILSTFKFIELDNELLKS